MHKIISLTTYLTTISFNRITLVVTIVLVAFFVLATSAQAIFTTNPAGGSSSTSLQEYGRALSEPGVNLQQFSLFNLDYTTWGMTKLLIGVPNTNSATASNPNSLANSDGGVLGTLTSLNIMMYSNPPISGIDYLASLGQDMGILEKPAYAQGYGYNVLEPVRNLWKQMRNIAYIIFVLIFLIAGIMIMFRSKIDPRTVVTISDALPRIVLALILVTFSYALAGLVVDLVELSVRVIAGVFGFANGGPGQNFIWLIEDLKGAGEQNIFTLMRGVITLDDAAWAKLFEDIVGNIPLVGNLLNNLGDVAGGLFGMIFGFALVMAMFKVFFMLLTSLVTIILLTIFSPFQFLFAALPGQGSVIGGWLRSMLSAASVFPVTFAMLIIAAIFAGQGGLYDIRPGVGIEDWQWVPPPLGVIVSGKVLSQLIAVGILLTTPKAGDIVRDALKQRPAPWAGEAGAALSGIARRILPF